jgi:hypothetical protein
MTEKAIRKRRGVELYDENPFMAETQTRTRKIINKRGNMMLINGETGEIQSRIAGFWESEEVDSTKFVKLFIHGVKALAGLSSAGTKMFEVLYLIVQSSINKDRIFISLSEIDQNSTPMSEATYTRGMRELIQKGFIAATMTQGWYWLNPAYVWNGDRLAFVKEYRKESIRKIKEDIKKIEE